MDTQYHNVRRRLNYKTMTYTLEEIEDRAITLNELSPSALSSGSVVAYLECGASLTALPIEDNNETTICK